MSVFQIEEGRWGYQTNGIFQEYEPGQPGFVPMSEETANFYFNSLNAIDEQQQVPNTISRAQAKLVLLEIGKLDNVQLIIDSIEDPKLRQTVQIEWSDRPFFEFTSPTLRMLASYLGISNQELAQLFIRANNL